MGKIKCPCGLREHMEKKDCDKTDCKTCCPLTQTNADRIRAMTDDDLARFILHEISADQHGTLFINKTLIFNENDMAEWLEQPAEEQEGAE